LEVHSTWLKDVLSPWRPMNPMSFFSGMGCFDNCGWKLEPNVRSQDGVGSLYGLHTNGVSSQDGCAGSCLLMGVQATWRGLLNNHDRIHDIWIIMNHNVQLLLQHDPYLILQINTSRYVPVHKSGRTLACWGWRKPWIQYPSDQIFWDLV